MDHLKKYQQWLKSGHIDDKTKDELKAINNNMKEIEDRFYKDLEFGTGGLRGIIGAGSNRMNIYTVGKATQGLAEYLLGNSNSKSPVSVVIGYDSRIMSKEFAESTALILCANGIKAYLFDDLRPTPVVSFATRYLKCAAGIMITASHNPKEYNGYKVYGQDGGQITDKTASEIISCINNISDLSCIKKISGPKALNSGLLNIIGEEVDKVYIDKVKGLSIRDDLIKKYSNQLSIIYTPLHGAGNIPVRRVLSELGYNVHVVREQEIPDGNFPTAPSPNPENPQVFEIALKMAEDLKPDVIFGTDPDSDRLGIIVQEKSGSYKVLTGNQTGVLLTHYILESLNEQKTLPKGGTIIKTIVTTDMAKKIADDYGCRVIDVLTGFKYIGEKIKEFEETSSNKFIFGFEESFGYLAGDFVRDKDAVIASMLVCEMALYYKKKNISLYDALQQLYNIYGFYKEELISINYEGREGAEKIVKQLEYLRSLDKPSIGGMAVSKRIDYQSGIESNILENLKTKLSLPRSNVLKFVFSDESWFVVRPSGTEPKMKIYLSVVSTSLQESDIKMASFRNIVMDIFKSM